MGYSTIQVQPINPDIGAVISGVDLSQPLANEAREEIGAALVEHLVVFFRDQHLDHDQHVRFSKAFGSLFIHPALRHPETHPEIQYIQYFEGREPPPAEFHTDATFMKTPFMGCILRAVDVPEVGGETMWASLYAAHDALSDKMQAFLSGLSAVHTPDRAFGTRGTLGSRRPAQAAENDIKVLGDAVHPVVRTHPVTGRKALFVNRSFTQSIVGLRPAESETLLTFLFAHIDAPDFAVRWHWRNGSVAFWDNRCTVHRAVNNFKQQGRLLFRTTIEGDVPV
jgi:taurine dioxygenase